MGDHPQASNNIDKENVNPNSKIQLGSGDSSISPKADDTNECITEEDAIEGNLKKIFLEATEKKQIRSFDLLKNQRRDNQINSERRTPQKKKNEILPYLTSSFHQDQRGSN
ncbi:uncharacterized protein LOC133202832 [Saccostrea echinata]|uniref:uncharacterized protein LOC133202832 n=1 Tax=Saccostrea echinata TaxID=191078 RepID=UPI002A7F76AB|nr:uncharacterized protein LOC133202832 [Saccostrea echinata]